MEAENVIFGVTDLFIGLLLIAISRPLKNGKVAMNSFYGVRLRKSYSSEKNWYLMNEYGGRQLMLWTSTLVPLGILAFFIPFNGNEAFIILFAFLPAIVLMIPTYLILRYSKTLSDA
jgi:hypothetical protein